MLDIKIFWTIILALSADRLMQKIAYFIFSIL